MGVAIFSVRARILQIYRAGFPVIGIGAKPLPSIILELDVKLEDDKTATLDQKTRNDVKEDRSCGRPP